MIANRIRQANRFAEGFKLSPSERYWKWASFVDPTDAIKLLAPHAAETFSIREFENRQGMILHCIERGDSMNNILATDMQVVLSNDMLVKADLMSMANGLEIRSPFLDYEVVSFARNLPADFKIKRNKRKRILQDAFREMLPARLYHRPKKGFEVPMLKWLRREMRSLVEEDLLSRTRIEEQGLFHYPEIEKLKQKLFSNNPGDVHARIWGLVVYQSWLRNYCG